MPRPSIAQPALAAFALAALTACAGRPTVEPAAEPAAASVGPTCRPLHRIPGRNRPIAVRVPANLAERADARLVISRLAPAAAAILVDEGRVPLESVMPFIRHAQVFAIEPGAGEMRCAYAIADDSDVIADDSGAIADDSGAIMDDSSAIADNSGAIADDSDAIADDSVPVALTGFGERFWSALLGRGGRELVGQMDDRAAVELTGFGGLVATGDRPPPPAHCSGPRFVHLAGDDPAHHACALLPPDHDPQRRYPAVYMLSGLAGDDTNRFGWDGFVLLADAIAAESGPVVFIGVNSRAPLGSIYPTEPREKPWLDWLAGGLQAAAEARLGVDPARDALFGQSTGGFNAVSVALLRPGAFRAVAASAPDALDLRGWLLDGDAIRAEWLAWMRLESAVGGAGQMVSYAAAWSPDRAAMPADLDSGAIRPAVLDAWLAHSPLNLLETPAGQSALKTLDGRLHLAVADNDEFGLAPPLKRFAARLDASGVAHRLHLDTFGHFGLDRRLPALMRALVADLQPAR